MKINFKALSSKAVKVVQADAITTLSEESLNQVVGGVALDSSIVACCCCYKYGSAEVLSSSISE